MATTLPMFPLNAVLFPGVSVPLKVFEDRYRALVHHLLRVDPDERYFGSVGIREGYEVGEHGAQSLFRIGCRVKMTDVEAHADGTFSLVAVGHGPHRPGAPRRHRRLPGRPGRGAAGGAQPTSTPRSSSWPGRRSSPTGPCCRSSATTPTRTRCRSDPAYLSWTLAAVAPLPLHERQALLEAEDAGVRLQMVTELLRTELRAMNVIPSLPATEVARTRWSPN